MAVPGGSVPAASRRVGSGGHTRQFEGLLIWPRPISAGLNPHLDSPSVAPSSSVTSSTPSSPFDRPLTQPSTRSLEITPATSVATTPDPFLCLSDPLEQLTVEDTPIATANHRRETSGDSEVLTTPSSSVRSLSLSSISLPGESSGTEIFDLLTPLRPSPGLSRPSFSRGVNHPAGASGSRLPLPSSPQPLGLSELFSGGPVTPDTDFGYFPASRSEPSSLTRRGLVRRPPVISPFRSYYGELRPSSSSPDHTGHRDAPKCATPSPDKNESGIPSSPKASSDGGFSSIFSSSGLRSPRIRNEDSVLAPHGSFTSARARNTTAQGSRSSAGSSEGSRQARETLLSRVNVGEMSPSEKDVLIKAATKGDQLAMHHLGLLPTREADKRYSIGSVENVWGPSEMNTASTRRSSASSTHSSPVSGTASLPVPPVPSTSLTSTTTARFYIVPDEPGLPDPLVRHHNAASNLFSDAARMALRSNAGLQKRRPSTVVSPLDPNEPKKYSPGAGRQADTLGKAHGDKRPKHRRAPSHPL